jgi:hypothetical protein
VAATSIQNILLAGKLGCAGGKALKLGQRLATFCISDLHLHAARPADMVHVIRRWMDHYGITEITSTWKSPMGDATFFCGPVETNDDLVGILLTRRHGFSKLSTAACFIRAL